MRIFITFLVMLLLVSSFLILAFLKKIKITITLVTVSFAEKFMTFAMPPRPRTAEDMDREIKELFRTLKRLCRSNIAR